MPVLKLNNITKSFTHVQDSLHIIKNASFSLGSGEVCSLVGPSGCGKSTLLYIIGLLENPTSGKLEINDQDCSYISDNKATVLRSKEIGFIYQAHHLLPEFNAIENIMIPLLINKVPFREAEVRAHIFLQEFNLQHRSNNLPAELSGGEQQRVAIARAMVHEPKLILADEPTGNLDEQNADIVFNQFLNIAKQKKVAVLIVTHNLELAKKTDRILNIDKGIIESY